MTSRACCHFVERSSSPESLPPRPHAANSEVAPLFLAPLEDATDASFQSSTLTSVDFSNLQSIFAIRDVSQSDLGRGRSDRHESDVIAATPTKSSIHLFGARISKKLSWQSIVPSENSAKKLRLAKSLERRKSKKLKSQGDGRIFHTEHSETTQWPREYDSDAKRITTATILDQLKQFSSVRSYIPYSNVSETLHSSVGEQASSLSAPRSAPVLCSVRRFAMPSTATQPSPVYSVMSETGQTTEVLHPDFQVPVDLCVQLPALTQLEPIRSIDVTGRASSDITFDKHQNYGGRPYFVIPPNSFSPKTVPEHIRSDTEGNVVNGPKYTTRESFPNDSYAEMSTKLGEVTFDAAEPEKAKMDEVMGPIYQESRRSAESLHLYNMRISQHLRSFSDASKISIVNVLKQSPNDTTKPISPAKSIPSSRLKHQRSDSSNLKTNVVPTLWSNEVPEKNACRSSQDVNDTPSGQLRPNSQKKNLVQGTTNSGVNPEMVAPNHSSADQVQLRSPDTQTGKTHKGKRRTWRAPVVYDGSADDNLAPMIRRQSTRSTVSSNHEEAAFIWEKALRDHSNAQSMSPRKRGISISGVSRKGTGLRPGRSSTSSAHTEIGSRDTSTRKARSMSQLTQFKPINTQHTFDRLFASGSDSFDPISSPRITVTDTSKELEQPITLSLHSDFEQSLPRADGPSYLSRHLLVPGAQLLGGLRSLNDDTGGGIPPPVLRTSAALVNNRPRSSSSLGAWSRYPSHTREERNGSAGHRDNVITRDFVPFQPFISDRTCSSQDDGLKKKNRVSRLKRRSMILKQRLFSDITAFFKTSPRGRRSSISVGGPLEYPELELLPPIQAIPPNGPLYQLPPSPSISGLEAPYPKRNYGNFSSPIGSENFSSLESNPSYSQVGGSAHTARGWSHIYTQILEARHSTSEISVRGEMKPPSRVQTSETRSLPAPRNRTCQICTYSRLNSDELLRNSTVDLFEKMHENEAMVREKALKSAEMVWE